MSILFVFIVIAMALGVFGSSITGSVNKSGHSTYKKPAPPVNSPKTASESRSDRDVDRGRLPKQQSRMKMEDLLTDFGDVTIDEPVVKDSESPQSIKLIKPQSVGTQQAKKGSLTPLLTRERLAESVILAELLDKPRAMRPHPLTKQQNMLQRRG